jgi:hypothetical protein
MDGGMPGVNSWQNRELYFSVSGDKTSVLSCSEDKRVSRVNEVLNLRYIDVMY